MRALLIAVVLGVAGGLSACTRPPELGVDKAWVRLPAASGRPAAAYFVLHGGPDPTTLINVTTDVAVRSEMHATLAGPNGTVTMRPLGSVAIPADGDVAFRPGGRHVMLFDVNPGIRPGERTILLTFTFADGRRVQRKAAVLGAGDPAPE